MSQAVPSPDELAAKLRAMELRIQALERCSQLPNSSITVVPAPAASIGNKGLLILDGNNAERVRLGATDSDASPAAAQSMYGASAKDASGKVRALFGQTSATPTYGIATFDAAGTKRFVAGQIDGSTDGAAAYDSTGALIWDTTGLSAMAAILLQQTGIVTVGTTITGSWTDAGVSNAFSITGRAASVLVFATGAVTGAGGNVNDSFLVRTVMRHSSVGSIVETGSTYQWQKITAGGVYLPVVGIMSHVLLPVGSYEVAFQVENNFGTITPASWTDSQVIVIRLGA